MKKLLILAILLSVAACTTVMTCGPDRLFTKGKEYCSEETFFWFEKPEGAFDKYDGKTEFTDCELEEVVNVLRKHLQKEPVISEGCE